VTAVRARGLGYRFDGPSGTLPVLDGLDLDVAEGERVAILGRSGSGKSTLLSLTGGLERPQVGELEVFGHSLADLGSDELARFRAVEIGFVFQHFGLLEALTALENVELAATLAGVGRARRRRRAAELLEVVGLSARAKHTPRALSGGERQRVAIARALVNGPRLLLADEPTGNLDDESAELVARLIDHVSRASGTAVVVVTHDVGLAAGADRRLRLRDGRLEGSA
jgi:putative ABC transport system ATP-binding protein